MKTNNPNSEPLGSGKEGRKTLPLPRLLYEKTLIHITQFNFTL